jgi:hypothetical protein
MDLLTPSERQALAGVVDANGGVIKYKSTPEGREPYELCCSTRDSLRPLKEESLEIRRYLTFYTLAFALMGRNVKSIYFNDLLALPNDYQRMKRTGELRDIKRTRSDLDSVAALLEDSATFEHRVARGMNDLIALVDSDPALHFRGAEAEVLEPHSAGTPEAVALVHCSCAGDHTLIVVNVTEEPQSLTLQPATAGFAPGTSLYDNINNGRFALRGDGMISLALEPFQRLWLSAAEIPIAPELRFSSG